MCTLVILRRPEAEWPVVIGANRDEMVSRPARPPGRHWPDRPDIVAGLDELGGGSWLGLNDYGVVAGVLNRSGTLGPETGKRSRGELVLEALDHGEAEEAAQALSELDPGAYRPFNLVVADVTTAYWLRNDGASVVAREIRPGLSMLTARELDDPASARIRRYRKLFAAAEAPDPGRGDWADWRLLLASTASETGDPRDAMCIRTHSGYGTCSSSLLALPADPSHLPVWQFADGPPDLTGFEPVRIG